MSERKAHISRRKRGDKLFGIAGAVLVVFSLGTLGVLVSRLIIDGGSRIFATHEVKPSGLSPERGDLMGKLVRDDGWKIQPDSFRLVGEFFDKPSDALFNQHVVIAGSVDAGNHQIDVDEITLLSAKPKVRDRNMTGMIERAESGALMLKPDALRIVADGAITAQLETLESKRVILEGTRKASEQSFAATGVAPIKDQSFLMSPPSRHSDRAGVLTAWVGSALVMLVTALAAVPLGIAAGIYLEEYARKNRLTALIEINIANLAGVPSIVWGLMALGLFVYVFALGRSIITAGLTLGLLVLPIIIVATRESLRAIPQTIREAAIAVGATKWQTIRHHLLPYSFGGILTGSIIALSRAIGETAPLVTIGALTYIAFLPPAPVQATAPFVNAEWLNSPFTVLPIQLFTWVSLPDRSFHSNAAAAGVILLCMTLMMNAVAIVLRYRMRGKIKW